MLRPEVVSTNHADEAAVAFASPELREFIGGAPSTAALQARAPCSQLGGQCLVGAAATNGLPWMAA
jgi:hypothetical protein